MRCSVNGVDGQNLLDKAILRISNVINFWVLLIPGMNLSANYWRSTYLAARFIP